jgi:hypothetical protein
MSVLKQFIFTIGFFCGVSLCGTSALARDTLKQDISVPDEFRGGLLYSTHCSTCHSSTIHWREQRLATDWKSLKFQVNRWQAYAKLGWTEEDIDDVVQYLNIHYYNFYTTEPKSLSSASDLN